MYISSGENENLIFRGCKPTGLHEINYETVVLKELNLCSLNETIDGTERMVNPTEQQEMLPFAGEVKTFFLYCMFPL
jgi:hypothetical protein